MVCTQYNFLIDITKIIWKTALSEASRFHPHDFEAEEREKENQLKKIN